MITNASEILQLVQNNELALLDIRPGHAYSNAHVAGAVSAPFSQRGWSTAVKNWVNAQNVQVGLFSDNKLMADTAVKALQAEGVEVSAVFSEGPQGWTQSGLELVSIPDVTVDELRHNLHEWEVIDVREPYEWRSGVIPQALKIPMNQIPQQLESLDKTKKYAIVCASGNRSQSAASYMADQGFKVGNVVGGMSLWIGAGHPVER